MSRQSDLGWKLTINAKGGPGSGNWGHAGRPGLVGGSAPGGGFTRIGVEGGAPLSRVYRAAQASRFRKALTYSDPDSGLYVEEDEWFDRYGDGTSFVFRGYIYDGRKRYAGRVERVIKLDSQEVYHSYFRLEKEFQGGGFGSAYYRNLERGYIKYGIEKITMEANLSVGGYAWARMGFDFNSKMRQHQIADAITSEWVSRYGTGRAETYNAFKDMHAWEMAALTGPDGDRIGKNVMLGTSWDAIKYLTPGSPHRRVGDMYYREKDKKKKK